jgi:hypothetical protein
MTTLPDNSSAAMRNMVYRFLIGASVAMMLARVMTIDSIDKIALEKDRIAKIDRDIRIARSSLEKRGLKGEELEKAMQEKEASIRRDSHLRRPFLSANDRSRWCTVRSLVEPEMRVEGFPYAIDKVIQEPTWDTIDMVKNNGHLYSSKPPLAPTLVAGVYWAIYHTTGMTLGTHPYAVGRIMLVLLNVIPLAISLLLLAKLVERFGTTDWGKLFVMTAAAFGTFSTTFAVALNNHVTAVVCCIVFLYFAVPIWFDGQRRWSHFFAAGLAGAFMAANDLPALSLFAAVSLAFLWKSPRQTLAAYLPGAILIIVPFFATNYIAHKTLELPYNHRTANDGWYNYTYMRNGKEYKSYWYDPQGFDRGEKSIGKYAFHTLIGHHGVFSLTPIWIMSIFGLGYFIFHQPPENRNYGGNTSGFRWVFWLAPLWLVALLPAADAFSRNRGLRIMGNALLMVSIFSATYPIWNPWCNPWIVDLIQ